MSLHVEAPTRPAHARPHRAVVVGIGLLTVLGLATVVTLPIVLDDRNASATTSLREQLQRVAAAQDAWRAEHGSYTTQLADLRMTDPDRDLAIVRADSAGFCAGAYDDGTRAVVFYSSGEGFSTTSCT